ncbi:MAG: hypothetical protein QGG54_12870 [Gammaproteobacteria bacterium]|jgi:hypothetical protein|nr:hypothetical protein [Gammaproteobacteria bacterium]MDP6537136.1 hypothetical protein [Gammaproteobacteria bacterium]MDP6733115.1 hypothetical protein [Gammaproteobacteria bacterium]HAJ76730.1 hypothetical protein [Gammaproteobacteria bacterium]|tara:strand:- start:350 stop:679 length:330 start_codon:yes stop_codon:yes gene_type:complete
MQQIRKHKSIKPILCGIVVFITVGLTIASESLSRFGIQDNNVIIFSAAFIIVAVLLSKNWLVIAAVIVGIVAFNQPEAVLMSWGVDRDVLLALVCGIILVPSMYRLMVE